MIQPIVEGEGDVKAVPVLLRRLQDLAGVWSLEVGRPHRRRRPQLVKKDTLQVAVRVAAMQPNCSGILILFDADDDCPAQLATRVEAWAREAAGAIPCAVVLAKREFEGWFLASVETLRGIAGIKAEATSHPDPEAPRNAKGELEKRMRAGASYSATVDQPRLAARLDLECAYRKCRSFRKLVSSFGTLATAAGGALQAWPPPEWLGS